MPRNPIVYAILDFFSKSEARKKKRKQSKEPVNTKSNSLCFPPCYRAYPAPVLPETQAIDSYSEREYPPQLLPSSRKGKGLGILRGPLFSKIGKGCLYTATLKETSKKGILLLLAYVACLYFCNRSGRQTFGDAHRKRGLQKV